tara:strand:+ start:291 stop:497 length:207 start_codon:yes stop_codon:yes gene_type:complete
MERGTTGKIGCIALILCSLSLFIILFIDLFFGMLLAIISFILIGVGAFKEKKYGKKYKEDVDKTLEKF